MYDYQKYLISKLNDVYQQIRLSPGLPLTLGARDFFRHTPKCTNLAQVYTINALMFQPLKHELNLNYTLYANDLHLAFTNWCNHFEALIAVDRVFNHMFESAILTPDPQTFDDLLTLNTTTLTRVLVNLVVEFRDCFYQIQMPNFLLLINEFNNKDYVLARDWEVLNDGVQLVQTFYHELEKIRSNSPDNQDEITARFLKTAQYWMYYLQAILVISFQVLILTNLETLSPKLKSKTAYEVLEKF